MDKLQAFELWCYRTMWRIPWTDKVTNTEVLNRMQKEREVINTIKLQYLDHALKVSNYVRLQIIMQAKVKGKGMLVEDGCRGLKILTGYN